MKRVLLFITAILLLSITISGAENGKPLNTQPELKGYLTLGNNVIALPSRLQSGDIIVFTNAQGSRLFGYRVTNGPFTLNTSRLHAGVYIVTIVRNGFPFASVTVPFTPGI
jgi:hypothetical protein